MKHYYFIFYITADGSLGTCQASTDKPIRYFDQIETITNELTTKNKQLCLLINFIFLRTEEQSND